MSHFRSAVLGCAAILTCLCGSGAPARAGVPLAALRFTPDITVTLDGTTVGPGEVAHHDLDGGVTAIDLGNLPADAHIDAYHQLPNGDQLLSFDTTIVLPGNVTAGPADVVRLAGSTYSIEFDGAASGLPDGVNIDAVTEFLGFLLMSFDTSVRIANITFADEDLVSFDPSGPSFSSAFSGANADVPEALDVDGAQIVDETHLLVSFDGSGSVGGVAFDDEDVLVFDAAGESWSLAYDGADQLPGLEAADLLGLFVLVDAATPTPSSTVVPSAATATVTPVVATATVTATTSGTPNTPTPTISAAATATATAVTTGAATATATAVTTGAATATATVADGTCVGDCNENGEVSVGELVTMVNIALDQRPVEDCLAGDPNDSGSISIAELVSAVNRALLGC